MHIGSNIPLNAPIISPYLDNSDEKSLSDGARGDGLGRPYELLHQCRRLGTSCPIPRRRPLRIARQVNC